MTTRSRGLHFPSFNFPVLRLCLTAAGTADWQIFEGIGNCSLHETKRLHRGVGGFCASNAWPAASQTSLRRPRLLIAETDPFTGLPLLKSRFAAGGRPSEDMEGWALSWLITGKDEFAERAVAEMRSKHLASGGKPSRSWVDYARWSLAFDWLFSYRGFDAALKDRVAGELSSGVTAMLATPDFADPGQMSYHNYALRYLALAAFPAAAVEGYPSCEERCRQWRDKISACLANILDITQVVSPEGSYHESMDYMRITWASLVMLAELQRTTTGVDPAQHFSVFRNVGDTYLYKLLPDGTPSREGDNEYPVLDTRDTAVLGYAVNRFKDPYSAWLLRQSGFFRKNGSLPVLQFLWDDPEVSPRNPALASETELPRQRFFPGVGHLVMRDGWTPTPPGSSSTAGPTSPSISTSIRISSRSTIAAIWRSIVAPITPTPKARIT